MNFICFFTFFIILCIAYISASYIDIQISNSNKSYLLGRCPCEEINQPICGNDLETYLNEHTFTCAQKNADKMGLILRKLHDGHCNERDLIDNHDGI